jgi:cystathionine gamma-synthase
MTSPKPPYLESPPLGARMPASVHAVTCSIPTMDDVIGYEERRPETMEKITVGYPRFVTHFYIRRIEEEWQRRHDLGTRPVFFTAAEQAAQDLRTFVADPHARLIQEENLRGLHVAKNSEGAARAKAFLQHTGCGISSRLAEDYLLRRGLIDTRQEEELADNEGAEAVVTRVLAEAFGVSAAEVLLATSGMNAFYALFRAIEETQRAAGRTIWIQLGWLYVDTIEILHKMTGAAGRHIVVNDVFDLDALERLLDEKGDQVAGIVTEVPTNPLIQTADLGRLRALAERHGIVVVLDPTLATPLNIDIIPHCDVALNSLTKYTGSAGDVMMGAAVFNPRSRWTPLLRPRVERTLVAPFSGDLRRLAHEMTDYPEVVARINRNTTELVHYLEKHPAVEKVYWAYAADSAANYTRLHRRPDSPGGLITIKLRTPLAGFYDRVQLPKGPSFGTIFTLMCPFLYLAHYDLVSTKEGREVLRRHGLDADLLRISVGTEDVTKIIAAFDAAL